MATVDFGKTAHDYGKHRAGFPEVLYTRLAENGIGERGQRIVDLGTGTGALGRGFARFGDEYAVALGSTPPHPAPQLVKL